MTERSYNIHADCRNMYEDEIFNTILKNRGIKDIDHFLSPTEYDLLPLGLLPNIDIGAKRVIKAIDERQKIGVLWDTDTDGITAGTVITRYLYNFIEKDYVKTFIDCGKKHGLVKADLPRYENLDLLIIVDSLDENESNYKTLKEDYGIDILILDHHRVKEDVSYDDFSILISSQVDYPNKALSGAGVVWKFCKYLDEEFLTNYADDLIDLAACGLVADMVDMTSMENRYIVSKGLEKINNPAIKKIVGGFEFNSGAISFSIAPIINAANRMNCNDMVMQAFLADDNKQVLLFVKELKKCKDRQNEEVARLLPDVLKQCECQLEKKVISVIIDTEYGIAGLLGNKLLEKYQRPILVLKYIGNTYSGSMRAVGVDDFQTICNTSGMAKADGHELASGIVIEKSKFSQFLNYLEDTLPKLKEEITINVDVRLNIEDVTRKLVDLVKQIDRISGEGFKPVKIFVDGIDEYGIGQMSDYKHLVIKPNDYLQIIKWNYNGSFDEMEDYSIMNTELKIVASLDSGFLGRKFVLKAICDVIEEAE